MGASTRSKGPQAKKAAQPKQAQPRHYPGWVYVHDDGSDFVPQATPTPEEVDLPPSPHARRLLDQEIPPSSHHALDEAQEENARLRRKLKHRRRSRNARKSRSKRHDNSSDGRNDSSDNSSSESETESESEEEPRNSFKHYKKGRKPFLTLHEHYPAVDVKYFKQIYFNDFKPRNLMRLAHNSLVWGTTAKEKKGKNELTVDPTDMIELLRPFEVYAHAICFFAARPYVALELHEALMNYRIRLMEFSAIYTFKSVRTYQYAFMGDRVLKGQDDPEGWLDDSYRYRQYLVPRPVTSNTTGNIPGNVSTAGMTCNNFNRGKCNKTSCIYSHVCSTCHQAHSASICTNIRPRGSTNKKRCCFIGTRFVSYSV